MSIDLTSNLSSNNFSLLELNENFSVKEETENLLNYFNNPNKKLAQSYASYLGNLISDMKKQNSISDTIGLIASSFKKNLPKFFKMYRSEDSIKKTQFLRNAFKFLNLLGKNYKDKNISLAYFKCSLDCANYGIKSTDLDKNDKAFFYLKIAKYYVNKMKPFLAEQAATSGLQLNPSDSSLQNSLKSILDPSESDSVKRKPENSLSPETTKKQK